MLDVCTTTSPIEVFLSYAHEDEALRQKLEKHLNLLQQPDFLTEWHDRKIVAGTDRRSAIDEHLNTAPIILLLISSNFLASNYCVNVEMKRALERYEAGEAQVIPILLSPVDLENAPFKNLQCLPRDAKFITLWKNRDAAWAEVAKDIREAIKEKEFSPPSENGIVAPGMALADLTIKEKRFSLLSEEAPCIPHSLTRTIPHPRSIFARTILLKPTVVAVLLIIPLTIVLLESMMLMQQNGGSSSSHATINRNHNISQHGNNNSDVIHKVASSQTVHKTANSAHNSNTFGTVSNSSQTIPEIANRTTYGATTSSSNPDTPSIASQSRTASSRIIQENTAKAINRASTGSSSYKNVSNANPGGTASSGALPEKASSIPYDVGTNTASINGKRDMLNQSGYNNSSSIDGDYNKEYQKGYNNFTTSKGNYDEIIQNSR